MAGGERQDGGRGDHASVGLFGRRSGRPAVHGSRIEAGRVLGDYRLVRLIKAGGMGQVWEAEQVSLGRCVALKLLRSGEALSDVQAAHMQREARIGGKLQHRSIVAVHAYGEVDGIPFIAQELVGEGRSLGDVIADARRGGDLPDDWYPGMAEFFAEIAEALQVAHDAGVVHRDIKPGNVLIGNDERPVIADFGLARDESGESFQRSGDLAGTYRYMSPEQAMAKRMGLDHRTDIFSLGVTLYEALTLRYAFDGDTSHQIAEKILLRDPPNPHAVRSKVPWDLSVICMKALEKRREDRYATMADFAADLRRHLANEPIHARPAGPLRRAAKWIRRHPAASASGAVTLVASLAITAIGLHALDLARRESAAVERRWAINRLTELRDEAAGFSLDAAPELIERCDAWLASARDLVARLDGTPDGRPGFRAELAALVDTAPLPGHERGTPGPRIASSDDLLVQGDLTRLIAGVEALADPTTGLIAGTAVETGWSVQALRDEAARLLEQTIASPEAQRRWNEAIASIANPAECPVYDGLTIAPQFGLLPIGRDPASGLWEFWHVLTGAEPQRDAAGRLDLSEPTGVALVLIPAGSFMMGSAEDDPEGFDDEYPQHEVTLSAFLLAKTECTQAQWQAVMGSNPSHHQDIGATAPVERVSWTDIQGFEQQTGLTLPSEAQWEYAARAGTIGSYHGPLDAIAWYDGNADGTAHPVGQKQANAFGLHDMSGNVWEWCEDTWQDTYSGAPTNGAPRVDGGSSARVHRGGGWNNYARGCRSADRNRYGPGYRLNYLGCRLSRPLR